MSDAATTVSLSMLVVACTVFVCFGRGRVPVVAFAVGAVSSAVLLATITL